MNPILEVREGLAKHADLLARWIYYRLSKYSSGTYLKISAYVTTVPVPIPQYSTQYLLRRGPQYLGAFEEAYSAITIDAIGCSNFFFQMLADNESCVDMQKYSRNSERR